MLSGGKGVHVVVPLDPEAEWPAVKDLRRALRRALAQAEPDRFIANMNKAKRKGKIFIDYLRNQRGATAVLPYVARARAGRAGRGADRLDRAARHRDAAALDDAAMPPTLIERANGRGAGGLGRRGSGAARPLIPS